MANDAKDAARSAELREDLQQLEELPVTAAVCYRIARCCTEGCGWGRLVDANNMPPGVTTPPLRAAEWSHLLDNPGHETTIGSEDERPSLSILTEVEHRLGDAFGRGWIAGSASAKKQAQAAIEGLRL